MWQSAVTLLIVAGVLAYLIRRLSKTYRSGSSICSSCPADCARHGNDAGIRGAADRGCPAPVDGRTSEDREFDQT
jgi:hypothetical protein